MKKLPILSLALLGLLLNNLFLNAGSRVALVIGNSNYSGDGYLSNPQNDATAIAEKLKKLDFKVIPVINGNIKSINSAINSFRDSIAKDCDIAFFFYSGHGVQVNGRNYLIPLEENFENEDDVESYAINISVVLDKMKLANNKILILDACRDNPFLKKSHKSLENSKGLAAIKTDNGDDNIAIIYATLPGEVADNGIGKYSPFTESLLNHIEKPVIIAELFSYVNVDVANKTKNKQKPRPEYGGSTAMLYLAGKPGTTPQPSGMTASDYYNRGNEYSNKGDYDNAIADYNQAIRLNLNYASAYSNRGGIYFNKGDYNSAIADYSQAIKIDPNFHDYCFRGLAYSENRNYNSAIADFNQAIKLVPNDVDAYYHRGLAYYYKGDYDSAIADYNQAIKIDPYSFFMYNHRGLAYFNKRDYDSAIADYNQAIKIFPNFESAYNNRGLAYYYKGNYDSAIADYNQAIKIDPNYAVSYNNRGVAYEEKGDYVKAKADYEEALRIDPNNTNVRNNLNKLNNR